MEFDILKIITYAKTLANISDEEFTTIIQVSAI